MALLAIAAVSGGRAPPPGTKAHMQKLKYGLALADLNKAITARQVSPLVTKDFWDAKLIAAP